jgi:alpha-L-fucosidase
LAKRAGIQYALLTAKHHDGYAMYHTQYSDFSIEHSPYGADILRQFLDAFREQGIKVGIYYSLIDWHHSDYPAFTEADKPYGFGQFRQPTQDQWDRFITFMFAQIRELLTGYGRLEVIWFDGGWERTAEQWRCKELEQMIRELQPHILINDRLPGCGDFSTPEQFIPPTPPKQRWEACMTINDSWGYNPSDRKLKSATTLIHSLCEIAGKGGNFLLNVSPMANGKLPPEQVERLEGIATWMKINSKSISATTPGLEPWQFYGPSTRSEQRTYLHLLMRPYESVSVRGFPVKRVKEVHALGFAEPLTFATRCAIQDTLFRNPDPLGELTIEVPAAVVGRYATVLAIDVSSVPATVS